MILLFSFAFGKDFRAGNPVTASLKFALIECGNHFPEMRRTFSGLGKCFPALGKCFPQFGK
jgi:hypothetical protein